MPLCRESAGPNGIEGGGCVTDSGEANTGDHWIAGVIRHSIKSAWLEASIQLDLGQAVRASHESPAGAGNGCASLQEMVTNNQNVLRIR
jgi:hypothetical protein